ncbi:MAG: tetratricopeptide repeat protein [Cyanobacteria bacterium]|nr:tetratricopeptide repeat protein [Cyanobacteriota bacterium]
MPQRFANIIIKDLSRKHLSSKPLLLLASSLGIAVGIFCGQVIHPASAESNHAFSGLSPVQMPEQAPDQSNAKAQPSSQPSKKKTAALGLSSEALTQLQQQRTYAYGLFLKGRYEEALKHYAQIVPALIRQTGKSPDWSSPDWSSTNLSLAQEYVDVMIKAKATEAFKNFLEQDVFPLTASQNPVFQQKISWVLQLCKLYLEQDRPDEAQRFLNKLPPLNDPTLSLDFLLLKGAIADTKHQNTELSQIAQLVYKQSPGNAEASRWLGNVAASQNRLGDAQKYWERALELQPNNADLLLKLADFLLLKSKNPDYNPERAILLYQRALAFDPKNADLILRIARLAKTLQQQQTAGEYYKKLLEINPDQPEALFELGFTAYLTKQWDQANLYLSRFIDQVPDQAEARYYLAQIQLQQTHNIDHYIESLEAIAVESPRNVNVLNELWELYEQRGQEAAIASTLDRILVLAPDNGEAFFRQGQLMCKQKQWSAALVALNQAEKQLTDAPEAKRAQLFLFRGQAHRALNHPTLAVIDLKKAVTLLPTLTDAHEALGLVYAENNQWPLASQSLERALQLDPNRVACIQPLAAHALYTGQLTEAERWMKRALTVVTSKKGQEANILSLSQLLLSMDKPAEALNYLTQALKETPDNPALLSTAGLAYLKNKQPKRAVVVLFRAAELEPNQANTWDRLGQAYLSNGLNDDAIQAFSKAASLEPNAVNHRFHLGEAYENNQQPERAYAAYEEALSLGEHLVAQKEASADSLYNLGKVYFRLGRLSSAEKHLLRALSKVTDGPDKAQMQATMGDIYEATHRPRAAKQAYEAYLKIVPSGDLATQIRAKLPGLN